MKLSSKEEREKYYKIATPQRIFYTPISNAEFEISGAVIVFRWWDNKTKKTIKLDTRRAESLSTTTAKKDSVLSYSLQERKHYALKAKLSAEAYAEFLLEKERLLIKATKLI